MKKTAVMLSFCLLAWNVSAQVSASSSQTKPARKNSILSVYDAFGYQKKGTLLDWGFAVLIQYNGKTILFDTGNNAQTFAHNVKALGVDLSKVDIAILSHRHNDHISGFDHLLKQKPGVKAYMPADGELGAPFNLPFVKDSAKEKFPGVPPEQLYYGGEKPNAPYIYGDKFSRAHPVYISKHTEIAPGIFLIYTTSPLMGDFSAYPPAEPGHPELHGLPEISLALQTEKGIVLVTGCSHSKVEEIIKAAKAFTHQKVALIDGGFHLVPYDAAYITGIAKQMKDELGVERVAPAHCTGNLAFKIFRDLYGKDYSYAGVESVVEF